MPIPAGVILGAQLAPSAISVIKGLLGGKSPQEKAIERFQKLSEQGLDPAILQRALAILNARNQAEQSGVLSRLAAGGIDPSSGLAQEAVGATRRGLGARQGEAQALFNQQSEAAKLAANQQLLGLPADNSLGDLLGSGLQALQAYGQRKQDQDFLQSLFNTSQGAAALPEIRTQLPTAPRGSMFNQQKSLALTPLQDNSPNVGMKLPTPDQFSKYYDPYRLRRGYVY